MEGGGGEGLGSLGGGKVLTHCGEIGLGFAPLIKCFLKIGGGICWFVAGAVDTPYGHPSLGENVAGNASSIGDDFTKKFEGFIGLAAGGENLGVPVASFGLNGGWGGFGEGG